MQHSLNSMIGFTIRATDGDLGKVDEFYFDDKTWKVRYMIAETGGWLLGRKVLISLTTLGKPNWETRTFSVNLTCEQVKNSPNIDTEKPVFRQHEVDLHEYYQWPQYWNSGYSGVLGITPFPVFENPPIQTIPDPNTHNNPNLRSTRQVTGYSIHATNGEIGHVEDFVVDDKNWALCFLIVATHNWLPGKKVLIPLDWIKSVDWIDASVQIDRLLESVKNSPEYDPTKPVQRNEVGSL